MSELAVTSDAPSRLKRRALLALLLLVPAPSIGAATALLMAPGTAIGQATWAISKAWILLLPLVWLLFVEKQKPAHSPVRRDGMELAVISGVVIGLLIWLTFELVGRRLIDAAEVRDLAAQNGLDQPGRFLAVAVYICTINALLEEYVWRWFVFRKCEALLRPAAAVVAAALLFTVHHVFALLAYTNVPITVLACTGIFVGGCLWSWFYLTYRSIWPGYVSHLIADIAVMWVGWRVIG